eukprot:2693920-Rhodomonas_salina.4
MIREARSVFEAFVRSVVFEVRCRLRRRRCVRQAARHQSEQLVPPPAISAFRTSRSTRVAP